MKPIVYSMPKKDTIAVSGIHLYRLGKHVIVNAEIEGKWVEVIRELHDGQFSHIVEPGGMRARVRLSWGASREALHSHRSLRRRQGPVPELRPISRALEMDDDNLRAAQRQEA